MFFMPSRKIQLVGICIQLLFESSMPAPHPCCHHLVFSLLPLPGLTCLPTSLVLLPEGEKNISTQRQRGNLFFTISQRAQIEIELDRDIRSACCDKCKRILFKNTLTFVHPVSNI